MKPLSPFVQGWRGVAYFAYVFAFFAVTIPDLLAKPDTPAWVLYSAVAAFVGSGVSLCIAFYYRKRKW